MTLALTESTPVTSFPAHLQLTADVRRARAGDTRAFERLVDRTKQAVASIALAVVRDVRASEDVAQEVYVQAWRDLGKLRNPDSFLPWLRQLTRNEAMTFLRSRRRYEKRHAPWQHDSVTVAAEVASTLDLATAAEEHAVLIEALDAMPDDTREVLTLFYREDRSVRQVAELLGLGEDAVKKRLERARAALRADVVVRFEAGARSSALAGTFTATVIAAITVASPGTAAAATALSGTAAAKVAGGAAASTLAGPLVGLASSLLAPYVGMRRLLAKAIDERERTELRRYRDKTMLLSAGYSIVIALVGWALSGGYIHKATGLVVLLVVAVAFGAYVSWMSVKELPAIVKRREDVERATEPDAFAERKARERRLRRIVVPLALLVAAGGVAVAVASVIGGTGSTLP